MKFKKTLLLVLTSLSLVSCGLTNDSSEASTSSQSNSTSSQNTKEVVKDLAGRDIEIIPGSYKKVVCIGAGALRLYSYVGDVSLLSGVEDIDNETLSQRPKMFDTVARPYVLANKETFKKLPSCGVGGPQAQAAEAEKIMACDPDIVISQYEDKDKEDALQQQIGVPVVTLKIGSKGVFDENIQTSLTLLGKIFNKQDRATELNNYINSNKQELSNRTKDVTDKPSTYICGLGNWGTTNHLMTAKNFEPFNVAHIKNAVVDLASPGIGAIEKEKFEDLGSSIDVMIIDAAAVKNIKPMYQEDNQIFSSVKAVTDNKVYLQMAYNAYYTNIEIALVNSWYSAKVVYPSLFEDVNIKDKTNEATLKFNGKALADEIYACGSSFGGYQQINPSTFFGK